MDRVEVLLKEYETLRQESLDSMNHQSQIVSFGLATAGLLAGAVLASARASASSALVLLVFSLAVPVVCGLVLYLWLGEVERMMRAGRFLADLENRINSEIDRERATLTWESWLRTSKTQMYYPYFVVVGLFLGLAVGSPVLGLVLSDRTSAQAPWALGLPWLGALLVAAHLRRRIRRFR